MWCDESECGNRGAAAEVTVFSFGRRRKVGMG